MLTPGIVLMGYGFTLPSNPFDTVVLRIKPALSPTQAALLSVPADAVHHLTPRTPSTPSAFPPALITLFTVLTATPTELALRPPPHPTPRNTLATHTQLLAALQKKLCGFPREPEFPPCTGSRRRAARVYRDAQLAVLVAAIGETEDTLRTLCADPAAVTIGSILAAPGEFRDAVAVCFGTTDERELSEGDHADLVVTLYICWRYVVHVRSGGGSDEGVWARWKHAYGLVTEKESEAGAEQFVRGVWEDVVPAAARAAPGVFGGAEWTVELLSWGMRVFGGEGVGVCVDGEGEEGEEGDELFVVFVE